MDNYNEIHDPMHMPDEEFFGKWDAAANDGKGAWDWRPVLRYDLFPGLCAVLGNVKADDYQKAKESLLTYYRTRPEKKPFPLRKTSVGLSSLQADMDIEKIIGWTERESPAGEVMLISPEWKWHSLELERHDMKTFNVLDVDMDGGTIEIHSKENQSGNAPYLDAVVNGQTKQFRCVSDTYISAGKNRTKNYGNEPFLYSREAAGPDDNPGKPLSDRLPGISRPAIMPISSETKRAIMRFDTEDISPAVISSLTLHFFARTDSGRPKKAMVFWSADLNNSMDEKTFAWGEAIPGRRTAYPDWHTPQIFNMKETGYLWHGNWNSGPGDRAVVEETWGTSFEWINSITRGYEQARMIPKYFNTGNEIYAYRSLEMLMSLYAAFPIAGYSRQLEAGWRTENLCTTFFGTLNSKVITPEITTAQLKYIYINMAWLHSPNPSIAANQTSAAMVGFLRLCAYFPELAQDSAPLDYGVPGSFRSDYNGPDGRRRNGISQRIAEADINRHWWIIAKDHLKAFYLDGEYGELRFPAIVNRDGSYPEATSGYMGGVVGELKQVLDIIKALDGTEDTYYSLFLESYSKLCKYMMDMCSNTGRTPAYGSGGRNANRNFIAQQIKDFYNPEFEYFAASGERGTKPEYNSILYPDRAIAFLRSGWLPNDFFAVFSVDKGGTHGHMANLALDVHAYNRELLVDAGLSSYSNSMMGSDAARTKYHNTIEINDKDQYNEIRPDKETFRNNQGVTLAANEAFDFIHGWSKDGTAGNTIYPGFEVNRKVLFLHNQYWIVSDYIIPADNAAVNSYKQTWQFDTDHNMTVDPDTMTAKSNYPGGANIQIVPADPQFINIPCDPPDSHNASIALRNNNTWKWQMGNFGEQYTRYIRYARGSVSGPVTYDTVLYPDPAGKETNVKVERIALDVPVHTATALKINIGENTGFYFSSNEKKRSLRKFGNFVTDGQMTYIETDAEEKIIMIAVKGAAAVKMGDTEIISGNLPDDVALKYNGFEIADLYSSREFPGGKILLNTFGNNIKNVRYNGKEAEFTLKGTIAEVTGFKTPRD